MDRGELIVENVSSSTKLQLPPALAGGNKYCNPFNIKKILKSHYRFHTQGFYRLDLWHN